MNKTVRLSNFELLRIIAMAMIVLLHCNYWMIGSVGTIDVAENPSGSFWRILAQQFCIVGANVFVMISGWFGINAKLKGGSNFLYQVVYHSLAVLLVAWLVGLDISRTQIIQSLSLGSWNWFVPCYLGLYILSPVLNAYVNNVSVKTQGKLLLCFLVFEALYGWILKPDYFSGGYSIISFIGLYLLARYLRLREETINRYSVLLYFGGYLLMTCIPAIVSFISIKYIGHLFSFVSYSSPIVIIASVFLFLFFSRINIKSLEKFINWGASSMFAVIMIHVHPVIVPYFRSFMIDVYTNDGIVKYTFVTVAVTIIILITCVLLDQPRKYTWNRIWERSLHPFLSTRKLID